MLQAPSSDAQEDTSKGVRPKRLSTGGESHQAGQQIIPEEEVRLTHQPAPPLSPAQCYHAFYARSVND